MTARWPITRQDLGGERGSVLIIAILVLTGILLLAAVAVGSATQNAGSDRRDANEKSALEAAEAGLQVATYRLNMLNPGASYCVGDAVVSPDGTGTCASSTYTLGNGSSYRYYTTPALGTGASCVGPTLTSTVTLSQRCITAVGITNGVTQRAQIRIAAYTATPLFQYAGLTGLKSISTSGNVSVNGSVASNGQIGVSGNVSVGPVVLGPSGSFVRSGNVTNGAMTKLSSPIVLDPVNPGTSNQSSLSGCPARQAAGYPSCNDDYRITNGQKSPVTAPYDQVSGVSYNPTTRALSMSGNSSWTIGGSIYNFCSINVSGNASISLAPGVKAEIIIDSPDDPGSGCPAGSGSASFSGNTSWTNPTKDPTALQILAYGLNNGSASVSLSGNTGFYGVVYAPQSTVNASGNSGFYGAIAANVLNFSGNSFNWEASAGTLQATSNGVYYRTAWGQCTPQPTTANVPGSGCG